MAVLVVAYGLGVLGIVQATGFLKGTVNRWPVLQELAMANDDVLRFPTAWPNFGPAPALNMGPRSSLSAGTGHG